MVGSCKCIRGSTAQRRESGKEEPLHANIYAATEEQQTHRDKAAPKPGTTPHDSTGAHIPARQPENDDNLPILLDFQDESAIERLTRKSGAGGALVIEKGAEDPVPVVATEGHTTMLNAGDEEEKDKNAVGEDAGRIMDQHCSVPMPGKEQVHPDKHPVYGLTHKNRASFQEGIDLWRTIPEDYLPVYHNKANGDLVKFLHKAGDPFAWLYTKCTVNDARVSEFMSVTNEYEHYPKWHATVQSTELLNDGQQNPTLFEKHYLCQNAMALGLVKFECHYTFHRLFSQGIGFEVLTDVEPGHPCYVPPVGPRERKKDSNGYPRCDRSDLKVFTACVPVKGDSDPNEDGTQSSSSNGLVVIAYTRVDFGFVLPSWVIKFIIKVISPQMLREALRIRGKAKLESGPWLAARLADVYATKSNDLYDRGSTHAGGYGYAWMDRMQAHYNATSALRDADDFDTLERVLQAMDLDTTDLHL